MLTLDNNLQSMLSFPSNVIPDLQAFTPGAHVLPQQQVVEGDGTDDVKLLPHHLLDEFCVHPMLTHGGVEEAETLQEDFHRHRLLLWETCAPLPQACRLGPQNSLDCLVLQHARHCTLHMK